MQIGISIDPGVRRDDNLGSGDRRLLFFLGNLRHSHQSDERFDAVAEIFFHSL